MHSFIRQYSDTFDVWASRTDTRCKAERVNYCKLRPSRRVQLKRNVRHSTTRYCIMRYLNHGKITNDDVFDEAITIGVTHYHLVNDVENLVFLCNTIVTMHSVRNQFEYHTALLNAT
jgi:hypothetical protein